MGEKTREAGMEKQREATLPDLECHAENFGLSSLGTTGGFEQRSDAI